MRTQIPINVPAWSLIIMPVLLIILIGLIVLLVIHLVKPKQKKTDSKGKDAENNEDKTLTSWIKKKDLIYWLLIICLGTISLFTFRYKDATEVISHWGFAGTIVSIILAVIAIGFTLFQTLTSELSSEKIAKSAKKISIVTNKLDTQSLVESSEIMKEAAEFLKKELVDIKSNLVTIRSQQESSNSKIDNLFKDGAHSKVDLGIAGSASRELIKINDFFKEVYPLLPLYPQLFTYYFLLSSKSGVSLNDRVNKQLREKFAEIDVINKDDNTRIEYVKGANMGSEGATGSFLHHLGITNSFMNLAENTQQKFLDMCKSHIDNEMYIDIIDQYIESIK
ncbi:hypothetical protein [Lysinibacillus sp.]|uniref:hypothetical protein n=1 Tax=Lysinibacillus sp. TaxID=1869345 RepID=UPI0028AE2B8A|nr:hypothetical protein [Lysinibacillus sp.]